MGVFAKCLLVLVFYVSKAWSANFLTDFDTDGDLSINMYRYWQHGIVPFYIVTENFEQDQRDIILNALATIMFKSCIKFRPVYVMPDDNHHVLVLENPTGIKKCVVSTDPHFKNGPHKLILGYDCLSPPNIYMVLLRALGLPFEHNRLVRNGYIDVFEENIEPGFIELFTRDPKQPLQLRSLPYDRNSVMHFGEREYSKNGHKTIVFRDHVKQERSNLTATDNRKIQIIYEDICRDRDRKEKIEICQSYPGVARKKREADNPAPDAEAARGLQDASHPNDTTIPPLMNLRVNRDITPPAHIAIVPGVKVENRTGYVDDVAKNLGIDKEIEDLVDQVNQITSLALLKAREKYCTNVTKPSLRTEPEMEKPKDENMLRIVHDSAAYVKSVVDKAIANLTEFCQPSRSIEQYLRASCPFFNKERCRDRYRSTKIGNVKYSTQHRPTYYWSTKYAFYAQNAQKLIGFDPARSGNTTDTEPQAESTTPVANRKKREISSWTTVLTPKPAKESKPPRVATRGIPPNKIASPSQKANVNAISTLERKPNSTLKLSHRRHFQRYRPEKTLKRQQVLDWSSSEMSIEKTPRLRSERSERRPRGIISDEEQGERHKSFLKRTSKQPEEEEGPGIESFQKAVRPKIKVRPASRPKHPVSAVRNRKPAAKHKRDPKRWPVAKLPRTVKLSKKIREFYDERKWPDRVVHYVLTAAGGYDLEDVRRRLREVNDILLAQTCVRLEEITEEQTENYEDYLVLDNSPDYVTGMVGGRQQFGVVELLKGEQHRQHAAMVVMAMLGFYFEVSRHDRDKYIRVHMRHVRPDKLHHFEKIREDATFPLAYDFGSATHPAWQYWRHVGRTGISTVATYKETDPDGSVMKRLGQNEPVLSELDLVKINSVYGVDCFLRGPPLVNKESEYDE